MQANNRQPPLFITGTQRSGTTLLHQILSASSQVWSRNELYKLHRPMFGPPSAKNDRQFAAAMNDFFGVSLPQKKQPLQQNQKLAFFENAMVTKAENANKNRWCLKDPQCTYYLHDYATAFPTAKFIFLIRDPRAVCRSYLDPRGFTVGRPTNWIVAAERWKKEVAIQLDFKNANPEKTILVCYESLVSELASTLEKLCTKCEVGFEHTMLTYYQQEAAGNLHEGNKNITRPPDPSKVNNWRSQLPSTAVATIETITRPLMHQLGYEPSQLNKDVSFGRVIGARLRHRLISEYRWQRYKLTGKS